MSDDPTRIIVFDTTLRDGEQAPGFSMDVPSKLTMARALDALGVDIIEAGFPIASPADSEATRQIARRGAAAGHCRAGPLPAAGHRGSGAGARAGRALAHSHVPGHLGSAPRRASCASRARRASKPIDRRRRAARASFTDDVEFSAEDATRSDRDFLCRVVEAVDRRRRDHDQPARHRRLRDARRDPRLLRRDHRRACRTPTRRSSARTATTISAWRSPTASPPSRAACVRSSARSTASASAPATRRSKRS